MTAPLKPIPQDALSLPSLRDYKNQCDALSKKLGKKPINLETAIIANRVTADGQFQILNQDAKNDFYCSAAVNWRTRSLQVKGGLFSDLRRKKPRVEASINETQRIPDACTITRSLVGDEELAGEYCTDGQMDPRLHNAQIFHSAQLFLTRCTQLQDKAAIMSKPPPVDFANVRLVNEGKGDGEYALVYENPMDNFFCEGYVDSNQHQIFMRHGRFDEMETKGPTEALEMTDACSMTEGLVGKEELPGECIDKKEKERDLETYLTFGFYGVAGVLANIAIFKIARRFLLAQVGTGGLPVWRHLAMAYAAASVYDGLSGIFLPKNHPIRKYGTLAAGATGLVFPTATGRALTAWMPQTWRAALATRLATTTAGRGFIARMVGGAKFAGKLLPGTLAVAGLNYAWGRWVVGSDYQGYVNKRVADEAYEEDNVYGLDGWDLLVVPLLIKGARGGSRWLAPDMMNSAICWDNDSIEEKYLAEDRKISEEAEQFIKEALPPLLNSAAGKDPNVTIARLRDQVITLNEAEREASALLFEKGPEAVAQKYNLNQEKIEELAYTALLQKVQEAAAYLVFVDQDRNDWARGVFNKNGTLKGAWDDGWDNILATEPTPGTFPYQSLMERFPYTPPPVPAEYWLDLYTGEKIPAFPPTP